MKLISLIIPLALLMSSCSVQVEKDKSTLESDLNPQAMTGSGLNNWQMQKILDFENFSLPLPNEIEFHSWPGEMEIEYDYWVGSKEDPNNRGFSFTISKYSYAPDDPPEGFLYDGVCEKISTFTIEEVLRDDDLRIEKVKTECGGLISYFLKTNMQTFVIWPERTMPIERLAIIEEILKHAKYSPPVN